MEMIHHFGHEFHPLMLLDLEDEGKNFPLVKESCSACDLPVTGWFVYGCIACKFYIHKSCAELPRNMVHPFHPQHTLTLHEKNSIRWGNSKNCYACDIDYNGFTYWCSECEFNLDVHCAALMPTKGMIDNHHDDDQHLTHPHPLILCEKNNVFDALCSSCEQPIIKSGPIFVCLECPLVMDESCARLPLEIKHPFHPLHLLTLRLTFKYQTEISKCNVCNKRLKGLIYSCGGDCKFSIDVCCSSLMPTTYKKNNEQDDQPSDHPHPLIHCYNSNKSITRFCSGCLRCLKDDSIYVCLDCRTLLDKSCANLLFTIKHLFHPGHRLCIVNTDRIVTSRPFNCDACERECKGFVYECLKCQFYLHFRCALVVPIFINSERHQHPLAFFNTKDDTLRCHICFEWCSTPFFRCVMCHFNLHAHCLLELPSTVKYKWHLHPLTLTYSLIKDYEGEGNDSEFLCDACEKERELYHPTYFCAECHYVAHVNCVISEILPNLQRESSLGDKFDKMKLEVLQDSEWSELESDAEENEVGIELESDAGKDEVGAELESDAGEDKVGAELESDAEEDEVGAAELESDAGEDEVGAAELESDAGDPVFNKLDAEIETIQIRINELTAQLETETMKLDRLKERRDQQMLSLQE